MSNRRFRRRAPRCKIIPAVSEKLYFIKTIMRNPRGTMLAKPRTAELVLVAPNGRLVGRLPAVPVATPWWQDVEPVVRAFANRRARVDYHALYHMNVATASQRAAFLEKVRTAMIGLR
jgi:hypothetical protein